ncbi:hypothetical protein MKW98_016951 [Papaver atlanticum]|uniref:Uncharacterized protein n=1 Tax=Papaver atlanticum TaxID=357466 RepID=A0AAD4TJK7_9MAGN|nr:hypothetical protein MKW98_016951 [Papaver atlanticum]
MASNKIHIFRQSAMEAGTPGKYYINPSPKLMSRASEWKVVEHEDAIETIFNKGAFVPLGIKMYKNQAYGDCENEDDDYSFIVNTDFLDVKKIDAEKKDDVTVFYFPKIKVEDNKKN